MMPFYCLFISIFFALMQYYTLDAKGHFVDLAIILNLNKTYFMYSGIAIQTYEWYNALEMIKFQSHYDITNV